MNVTVNEHGGLVAVRIAAARRARQRVLDGALAARAVEFLPHRGDEFPEPPGLAGAGRQTAVWSGTPDPRRSGDQDLVPSTDRQSKLVERATQPFEQKRPPTGVIPEQPGTPFTGSEPQHRYLVHRCVTAARDDELQDSRSTVLADGLGHERLGRVAIGAANSDPPVGFDAARRVTAGRRPRRLPRLTAPSREQRQESRASPPTDATGGSRTTGRRRACHESLARSCRTTGHPVGLRRVHGIAQMRDTHTGDDCRIPEDDRCVREVVEQPHSCA